VKMMKLTGAEAVARAMKASDVEYFFYVMACADEFLPKVYSS
jgi:hypothetical protein